MIYESFNYILSIPWQQNGIGYLSSQNTNHITILIKSFISKLLYIY